MTGRRFRDAAFGIVLLLAGLGLPATRVLADELPRRPGLGVAVQPEEGGLRVLDILPETSAATSDIQKGDLLLSLDGKALDSGATLARLVLEHRTGETIRLSLKRGEQTVEREVTLKERPRESSPDFDVDYGSVVSGDARLRTIVTRPRAGGRHPGVLLIQGLGAFSIDNPAGTLSLYRRLSDALTQASLVTMRVEKPGMGDSTGGPCSEIDFQTELDGYRQALKALRERADVDPENLYIIGHSMGGVMGPILAAETPVRGVVVYGTALKPWFEYLIENTRRQMLLGGASQAEIDRHLRNLIRFEHALEFQKLSPEQIAQTHPDLKPYIAERYPDGVHEFNRHYRFFQQLADLNLAEIWEKVDAHVYAIWGTADFVSGRDDHEAIAALVNKAHPGQGRFLALEGNDHGFSQAASFQEALEGLTNPLPYRSDFVERVIGWIQETAKRP